MSIIILNGEVVLAPTTPNGGVYLSQIAKVDNELISFMPFQLLQIINNDSISINENEVLVTNVVVAGGVKPYDIGLYGTDSAKFTYYPDENSAIKFDLAPDFENPTDDNTDNVYEIQVRVEDALGTIVNKNINIHILDVDEGP